MRKFTMFVALLSLAMLNIGCEKTSADKKAEAEKKALQADVDANKAVIDSQAAKSDADSDAAKKIEKAQDKKANALDDAEKADSDDASK